MGFLSSIGSVFGGSAGGFLGGIGDFLGDGILANSANAKAKRQANFAFLRQKQLIDEANEYNKPVNQMARLDEAGLNPNLVYENGAQTLSANIGAPAQAKTFAREMPKIDLLQNIATLKNLDRQEEKTQAEIDSIHHGMKVADDNIKLAREMMDFRERQLGLQERVLDERMREFEMRNGDSVLDFIGGVIGGLGDGRPASIGARDVRPAMVLGQHAGKFLKKNGAKMLKNYDSYGLKGLMNDLPMFGY